MFRLIGTTLVVCGLLLGAPGAAEAHGMLYSRFIHGVQNPAVKGIEIVRLNLAPIANDDVDAALAVVQRDRQVDSEYEALTREIVTCMMDDPIRIPRGLAARALELVVRAHGGVRHAITFLGGRGRGVFLLKK